MTATTVYVRWTSGSSNNNEGNGWLAKKTEDAPRPKICLDTSHNGLFSMLQESFTDNFINSASVN
jgi:hypothetical protein